jgi:hypothetical protein
MITNPPKWYGKNKYHYTVKLHNHIIYRCTSTAKDQDEVLKQLIWRFESGDYTPIIHRNGELIYGKKYSIIERNKRYGNKPK